MAPNYQVFENPITLWTQKAMRVMGMLAEKWAIYPESRPAEARAEMDGRILVLSTGAFEKHLASLGEDALGPTDITFRDGISEVEIVLRAPGRATLLMPEASAMADQRDIADNPPMRPTLQIGKTYLDQLAQLVSPVTGAPGEGTGDDTGDDTGGAGAGAATGSDSSGPSEWQSVGFLNPTPVTGDALDLMVVKLDTDDAMERFLHPYMGAYICTQCI
ncbi:MAG: hypothetical protein AAFR46_11380 [Pseudomonadota bacterium]